VTYYWKALDKGYNFISDLISIGGLNTKLWGSKVTRVPTLAILGFPLRNLRTKMPFGCGPHGKAFYCLLKMPSYLGVDPNTPPFLIMSPLEVIQTSGEVEWVIYYAYIICKISNNYKVRT
jgi:hypothetical protein